VKREQNGNQAKQTMSGEQQTILIVEDELLIKEFMIAVLKDEGYNVLETDCGDEAVQIFIDRYEDIDLVLLDMQMPDKNGAEVLEGLQFIDASVKAFFVSGVVVDWESLGAIGILQKPFQAKELAKAVRDILP